MTDKITAADEIELVLNKDGETEIINEEIDLSIGFDSGDRDVEPTTMVGVNTEYEYSVTFEPSPQFLLLLISVLLRREVSEN